MGAIGPILGVTLPYAVKGIALLVGYIGGRLHQKKISARPPVMPAAAAAAPGPAMPPSSKRP